MAVIPTKTIEDIHKERQKCSFDIQELTYFLDGGEHKTIERKSMENFFLTDPELQSPIPSEYLSHKEKYIEAVRISCLLFKKINSWTEQNQSGGAMDTFQSILGGSLGTALVREGLPFSVHYVMFIPTIMGQGTMSQQAYWINKAWNCQIMCTYAQTELGHGTFIRGLETTATYDTHTEEFVLNSPTLTSYKWWPGGLGHTCNYAVVLAQLYTKGICHGIHPFVVQLRDEETWLPLPGIKIGEIGCKLGMNTVNNGYLGFDNVRIPRDRMLMKNNKVLKDGTYIKSQNDKLTYGTMIFVRVVIVKGVAAANLAKAVTIAIRYSAVRRQSEITPGAGEPQILDYVTQQYKLFPALASVFALKFSADWLWDIYNKVNSDLEHGDMEQLPELHAMACCLKAVSTSDANEMIEVCRFACGGHGYMSGSSFPNIYTSQTAAVTYEGENTVLFLQTARYLIKAWKLTSSTKLNTATLKYLNKYSESSKISPWNATLPCIANAFYLVAAGKIKSCSEKIDRIVSTGTTFEKAWNDNSIELSEAAKAHCRAFIVNTFANELANINVSKPIRQVITQLCKLYAVYWLLRDLGNFLLFSNLTSLLHVDELTQLQTTLLEEIRPNAVGLVDSFDIADEILGSALGAYDGRVYERLFEEAQKSPLNQNPVPESFHKYLKPFLKSNM